MLRSISASTSGEVSLRSRGGEVLGEGGYWYFLGLLRGLRSDVGSGGAERLSVTKSDISSRMQD